MVLVRALIIELCLWVISTVNSEAVQYLTREPTKTYGTSTDHKEKELREGPKEEAKEVEA